MRIAALIAVPLLVAGCSHAGSGDTEQTSTQHRVVPSDTSLDAAFPIGEQTSGTAVSGFSAGRRGADRGPSSPGSRPVTAGRSGPLSRRGTRRRHHPAGQRHRLHRQWRAGGRPVLHDGCQAHRQRPGVPGQADQSATPARDGLRRMEGRLGRLRRHNLQVGETRGDPGPFVTGNGAELANGDSLSFDDYRCRADQAGLFCVNYAHQSAVRFSAAGIEPFGCLRSVPAARRRRRRIQLLRR